MLFGESLKYRTPFHLRHETMAFRKIFLDVYGYKQLEALIGRILQPVEAKTPSAVSTAHLREILPCV